MPTLVLWSVSQWVSLLFLLFVEFVVLSSVLALALLLPNVDYFGNFAYLALAAEVSHIGCMFFGSNGELL